MTAAVFGLGLVALLFVPSEAPVVFSATTLVAILVTAAIWRPSGRAPLDGHEGEAHFVPRKTRVAARALDTGAPKRCQVLPLHLARRGSGVVFKRFAV